MESIALCLAAPKKKNKVEKFGGVSAICVQRSTSFSAVLQNEVLLYLLELCVTLVFTTFQPFFFRMDLKML